MVTLIGGLVPLGFKVEIVNLGNYKKKKLVPDLPKAKALEEAYQMKVDGWTDENIINNLNERGITNTNRKTFYAKFSASCI